MSNIELFVNISAVCLLQAANILLFIVFNIIANFSIKKYKLLILIGVFLFPFVWVIVMIVLALISAIKTYLYE